GVIEGDIIPKNFWSSTYRPRRQPMLAKMYEHILRHVDSDTGATAVEYSLLLGLIAAVIVVVVTTLGTQAVVQNLGRLGRGKLWLVVTSQEKLSELVGGLDDKRVELARLMDRFPLQVHLEPADISEVTSKRVLSKKGSVRDVCNFSRLGQCPAK